jgi:hypothetical protein
MVGKAQKSHGAGSGLYGRSSNGVPPIHFFQTEHRIQFRSRLHAISGLFQPWKMELQISKGSTVCSTYSRSGWSGVRSASLAKGSNSKKRPSLHLHKVPSRNTLQTALIRAGNCILTFAALFFYIIYTYIYIFHLLLMLPPNQWVPGVKRPER